MRAKPAAAVLAKGQGAARPAIAQHAGALHRARKLCSNQLLGVYAYAIDGDSAAWGWGKGLLVIWTTDLRP
ncbi:hypothetical protein CFBP8129_46070 (plasmid) [Xanthomonas hortorum pv. gardneri]|uniref:Uncharacterized protein n=1 Tax=Xanthomonas hortorum pv. gardneri TaxID=2754056 RepID=A0A6V7FH65_9XANT|nr:hypothetical protein CFBP8129_46070 [Xanthomonas hortorum pv. gardneri]CAD0362700.1 hypothetical protein CFBP8129_46070 [Xanthomonas hortorum pv. gardneri]